MNNYLQAIKTEKRLKIGNHSDVVKIGFDNRFDMSVSSDVGIKYDNKVFNVCFNVCVFLPMIHKECSYDWEDEINF